MYYDWHHSFSDTRHRLARMASLEQSVTSGITVHRTRAQGDYQPAHIERFDFLLPHLERAVSIGFRLGAFGAMQQMSFQMLDANPFAIIVLDELGRVIFVNQTARELVAARDGLVLSGNGLSSGHHGDNQKLQNFIRRALALADGETAEPAGAMQALRPSGKRPYSILVSPICQARSLLGRVRPAACIVIADPERRAQIPERTLRILYRLTPAEVRLAR
jgi:PAS domain-containing protein